LVLDAESRAKLETVAKSRTEGQARVERAKVLLAYADGGRVTALAKAFNTNRPKIERILDRALEMGAMASLDDRHGRGRKPRISPEARAWLLSLACTKPTEFGYPEELWATRTLALHAQKYGPEAGHSSLAKLGRGTVSKLLTGAEIRPHINQYVSRIHGVDPCGLDFFQKSILTYPLCDLPLHQEVTHEPTYSLGFDRRSADCPGICFSCGPPGNQAHPGCECPA
jgi:transposase